MIEYTKYGWGLYWAATTGSVLYSTAPKALVAMCFALIFKTLTHLDQEQYIVHPAAYFNSFSIVLGFLIVFRTNMAHSRFWEGRTQAAQFHSKLNDVVLMSATFVASEEIEARKWKSDLAQLAMLYELLAMAHLRGVVDFDSPMLLGICTPQQLALLRETYEPHAMCNMWIYQMLVMRAKRAGPGGVDVSGPVWSRIFQVLSDASLSLANAKKVTDTPFPFPYAQLLTFFLGIFLVTCPLVIGTFIQSTLMTCVVSSLSVWAFYAINRVAIEIEDPFGTDSNDLPLARYVSEFQSRIFTLGIPLVALDADDEAQQVKVSPQPPRPKTAGAAQFQRSVRRLQTIRYEAKDLSLTAPPEIASDQLPTLHGSQLAVNEGMVRPLPSGGAAAPPGGSGGAGASAAEARARYMSSRHEPGMLKAMLASAHGNFSFALAKKYNDSSASLPAFERTASQRALPISSGHSAASHAGGKGSNGSGKRLTGGGYAVLT